jgi:hypothetical protein
MVARRTVLGVAAGLVLGTTVEAAAAIAAVSGMPLPNGTTCPVTYLSRSAWGADESLRYPGGVEVWPAESRPVQALTVHHSAGSNGDPDPAATVRAIYRYQAETLGWGDIGYHLLIDEAGRVYEGRWSGDDGRPVFGPAGPDGRPLMVVAGHVLGYNAGNIGVCLLGTFSGQRPTAAERWSLARVLWSLARLGRLGATSTITYRNPDDGSTRTVPAVSGHRDWAATACPGDAFYATLADLRRTIATPHRWDLERDARPSGK